MAQSLEQLRNQVLTSIYGRRVGLAAPTGNFKDCLIGVNSLVRPIIDMTSGTTATPIPAVGLVTFTGTSLATSAAGGPFVLSNPIPGVSVTVFNVNAASSAGSPGSTSLWLVRPTTNFYIQSSEGTTLTSINVSPGGYVELTGLSTGVYAVTDRSSLAGVVINGTT